MPISQSDIDALNAAIAQGERQVRIGDKSVEYRSVDELIRARNELIRQQSEDLSRSGQARPRQTRLYHAGRGF